jgi:uncharacterized protein YgbK (DUF1537 family)
MKSRLLYTYYGDDFTGSTDVLEALALHGVPSVLFTSSPSSKDLKTFAHCRAIGIAGESRSQSPGWMTRHLPGVFSSLRELGAPMNHYKVCSTFDSSPRIGSIGKAMEIGRRVFHDEMMPVVVGAPHLGRSVVFSNLFAVEQGTMHRIDRHPTMRQHPTTPMSEADLRLHLARQTSIRIGAIDLRSFQSGQAEKRLRDEEEAGAEAIVFDGLDDCMLDETARLLWGRALRHPLFAVGSSGLTYGLMHLWRKLGLISESLKTLRSVHGERVLVLSGSCSPVTARQIERAKMQGFDAWQVRSEAAWDRQWNSAIRSLTAGKSVLLYTALGPGSKRTGYGRQFSGMLGRRLRKLVVESGVRRVIIVGGDTSTHVMKQLEISALTFAAALTPGVPLCRSHAPGSSLDQLEIALKGGQIGPEDFFARVRDGRLT